MFAPRNSSPVAIYGKEDVAAYEVNNNDGRMKSWHDMLMV